jgi:FAD/FMN-containing dehydrogenase
LPSRGRADIAHALGLRIDESLIELSPGTRDRCRDDAAPLHSILRNVFSCRPQVVVFPDSGRCVADIIDVCIEESTPAVPRGLGGAGLGGAVPVTGGVVVDLSRMCKVLDLDAGRAMVTVEAGCTWQNLRDSLAVEGLSLVSYPANTAGSTVGGWLSTGGYGVGTLVAGRFHASVESMEVVVPSGILVRSDRGDGRYSIGSFSGTEGQLGIVTSLTFPVKTGPEMVSYRAAVGGRAGEGLELLERLCALDPPPVGNRLLVGSLGRTWAGTGGLALKGPVVAALFEGSEAAVRKSDAGFTAAASGFGVEILGGEEAGGIFEMQATDPVVGTQESLVRCGEITIAVDRLTRFIAVLEKALGDRGLLDIRVVDRGLALVMVFAAAQRPQLPPVVRDVPATFRISQVALQLGGRPYGIGIWNTPLAGRALGRARKSLKVIKQETDRPMILNPGKFFKLTTSNGLPVWGWPYKLGLDLIRRF